MARPSLSGINSGLQNWDDVVDDNFDILATAPIPIHQSASLTEANLQATFPAASYDRCLVWVNHSVVGYLLYESNGTVWRPFQTKAPVRTFSITTSMTAADTIVRATGAGTIDFDLVTAATYAGRTIVIRNDSAGNLDVDPNGSEEIDAAGAGVALVLAAGTRTALYSDGSAWWQVN